MNFLGTKKIKFSKKIVDRIIGKTNHWVIQGGVFIPFTVAVVAQAITYILEKRYPKLSASKIITICTNHGNQSYFIFDEDEFIKLGRWCIKNPDYISRIYKQWEKDSQKYYAVIKRFSDNGIDHPFKDYKDFYQKYLLEYSTPLITEYYALAGDEFVRQLILKYRNTAKLQKTIHTLTLPPKLLFLQQVELAELELSIECANKKLPKKLIQFKKKFPSLYDQLEKIQKSFFWIRFNYRDTKPLSISYFYSQVLKRAQKEKLKNLNKRYKKLKNYESIVLQIKKHYQTNSILTKQEVSILKKLGFATYWQDQRKKANLIGNYWGNIFLKFITKTSEYKIDNLRNLLPSEFVSMLKGDKLNFQAVKLRIKGSLHFIFSSGEEGIVTGINLKKLWEKIRQKNHPGKVKEFRGITASVGKYIGRVRKIETPISQGKKMKVGEVLVAYMTRPDFVPLMHKAGAIITDEGGLTSHAAIISRELKIPCVIGTHFAMRVLKDGDKVEVDADHGIIRKI